MRCANRPFRALRLAIYRAGQTTGSVAEAIGVSRASFSAKLNKKHAFTLDEIKSLVTVLNIADDEIGTIFFER